MRVAASDISTQDTSTDVAMEVKCASSDTEPLAFWEQHSRRLAMLIKLTKLYLSMSSALVPVEATFSKSQQLVSF